MISPATDRISNVTGATGYLGSRVKAALERSGWRVVSLSRNPPAGSGGVRFRLGDEVVGASLAGATALVHCAYDFKEVSWARIRAVNVQGSEKLFRSARQANIKNLVYVSTISAFEGCRSLYGKAKLESEAVAHACGAVVLRPGLIFGEPSAGMFDRLVRQVQHSRVLPLFNGGSQLQYLVHDEDLSNIIAWCAAGVFVPLNSAITVAHEQPWTFRQILEEIARACGKRISFLPLPWRLFWAGLKFGELCHLPLSFRSDSLLSLMYQNPTPSFDAQRKLGISCRPFQFRPNAASVVL